MASPKIHPPTFSVQPGQIRAAIYARVSTSNNGQDPTMQTREQVDTSTPTGKMVFTVLGAVAELERSLIAERVRAGIRNARSKGKTLGRPRVAVDTSRIAALRAQGHSWGTIHRETGIGHKGLFMAFLRLLHHRLASIAETNLSVMLSMAARGADRR